MRFQPLIVWWLAIPALLVCAGIVGWQLYTLRKAGKTEVLLWVRRAFLVLLFGLMVLGPSVPGASTAPGVANLDVLFVVDTTASMGAEDYLDGQRRLAGTKADLLALSSKLKGAHLGIVTFDSNVNVLLPFTADSTTFEAAVKTINLEIFGTSKGSAIDKPLETTVQQLSNSKAVHPERSRLMFYMGDGEQTSDEDVGEFKGVTELIDGGGVLGYGTAEGAKIQKYTGLADANAGPSYINTVDPGSKELVPAVSKRDEAALQKLAAETGVTYFDRSQGGSIDDLVKDSKLQLLIDQERKVGYYINLYWLFAIPFVVLLFFEWKTLVILLLELRKAPGGTHV